MPQKTCIMGVGSALLDILARIPETFLDGVAGDKGGMELVTAEEMERLQRSLPGTCECVPGGSAANTIIGLSQLGCGTRLLSKVGDDENGAQYVANACRVGVDCVSVKTHPSEPTGVCLSLITPDTQRTMRTFLGASATMEPADVVMDEFVTCTHVHVEGYILFNRAYTQRVLETARAAGCTISLDLASPEVVRAAAGELPDLLHEFTDIVMANEDEAAALTGSRDEDLALQCLATYCPTAVVKLGPRGALVSHAGETVRIAARRIDAVDTTGAGDLWAAGFLYGLLHGRLPQEAGALGADVAAEVVQVIGASLRAETWSRIRRDWHL